uniref:Uncharacterized protein n=1 Tax=Rhizophora mucronata TaxID=61149 RepID=A0A2P2KFN7_RHIMU
MLNKYLYARSYLYHKVGRRLSRTRNLWSNSCIAWLQ